MHLIWISIGFLIGFLFAAMALKVETVRIQKREKVLLEKEQYVADITTNCIKDVQAAIANRDSQMEHVKRETILFIQNVGERLLCVSPDDAKPRVVKFLGELIDILNTIDDKTT